MLSRIDYMVDEPSDEMKMIEFNLLSVGVFDNSHCHDFLLKNVFQNGAKFKQTQNFFKTANILGRAVDEYEKLYKTSGTWILLVMFDNDVDIMDYRRVEIELWKLGYSVKVRSLVQLRRSLVKHDGDDDKVGNRLSVEGDEISLVYFRTLPDENNFSIGNFETVIRPIELSRAIKLPDVGQILISFKTFQQYFTQNEHVFERFVADSESCREMRQVLMDLHQVNDLDLVNQVLDKPQDYVLKLAYGEGGGGCFSGDDMKLKLEAWKANWEDSSNERSNFLLMKKIHSPSFENVEVTHGYKWKRDLFNPEYGFYGSLLSVDGKVIVNDVIGSAIRSKAVGTSDISMRIQIFYIFSLICLYLKFEWNYST